MKLALSCILSLKPISLYLLTYLGLLLIVSHTLQIRFLQPILYRPLTFLVILNYYPLFLRPIPISNAKYYLTCFFSYSHKNYRLRLTAWCNLLVPVMCVPCNVSAEIWFVLLHITLFLIVSWQWIWSTLRKQLFVGICTFVYVDWL